jgi:N-acetylglucosaminyldiphosphoundecaprenol N-acetyl-beta-D-mannosaminyltransferase
MIDRGRRSVLGVDVNVIDYDGAIERIMDAATRRAPLAVSALAVHGVMTGVLDPVHLFRLNRLDLVLPDGQPVRWALRLLHGEALQSRVYGPELMLRTCERAARDGRGIYLYGSSEEVLDDLRRNLEATFPRLRIVGSAASRFRQASNAENDEVIEAIQRTGAEIVFVGLGCPRQEVFVFENAERLSCPAIAVGAAFDFHAGRLPQAPRWMQDRGLEWFYRLVQEPRRLWRRYAVLNPLFCWHLMKQWISPNRFGTGSETVPQQRQNFV